MGQKVPPGKEWEMGSFSAWHWLIVLAIAMLLFGKGKIPTLMGDVAQGIKAFKSGMRDDAVDENDKGVS